MGIFPSFLTSIAVFAALSDAALAAPLPACGVGVAHGHNPNPPEAPAEWKRRLDAARRERDQLDREMKAEWERSQRTKTPFDGTIAGTRERDLNELYRAAIERIARETRDRILCNVLRDDPFISIACGLLEARGNGGVEPLVAGLSKLKGRMRDLWTLEVIAGLPCALPADSEQQELYASMVSLVMQALSSGCVDGSKGACRVASEIIEVDDVHGDAARETWEYAFAHPGAVIRTWPRFRNFLAKVYPVEPKDPAATVKRFNDACSRASSPHCKEILSLVHHIAFDEPLE